MPTVREPVFHFFQIRAVYPRFLGTLSKSMSAVFAVTAYAQPQICCHARVIMDPTAALGKLRPHCLEALETQSKRCP